MRLKYSFLTLLCCCTIFIANAQDWLKVTHPTAVQMRQSFKSPPLPYAQTMDYGLGKNFTPEGIAHDLDEIYKQGIRAISIEGVPGSPYPYLSDGYMQGVRMVVAELKKRNMHLWIIDEGQYPSGFSGGLISEKAPELRMQGLVLAKRMALQDNEKIDGHKLASNIVSAVAYNPATQQSKIIDVSTGTLNWPGMPGIWHIFLAEHRFKTAVTRSANNPKRIKDTSHSLIDYLNPEATRKWMEFTHERYKQYVGDEFGKTILGFRGDEPEFGFTPWSPKLPDVFKEKKGYDIRPYLATFMLPVLTAQQKLAKADFWDVWSDMFRDNYFKVIADWCTASHLEYTMHINHEDKLMDLARSEGDFFKTMRYVHIPGVDAIWHQIWYDNVTDFSKLASSAAHMYGRPRALSETFAAYTPKPTVTDVRWVLNEQMARGINLFEFMHWGSEYIKDTAFIPVSAYVNRATWLMANGTPTAKIALYCPTETMWLGNKQADSSLLTIGRQLLQHQLDFDYVDRQGITSVFKISKGSFINNSGQAYTAVIIPTVDVLNKDVLDKLTAFAQQGGKVYFIDQFPKTQASHTFIHASATHQPAWAKVIGNQMPPESFFEQLPHDISLSRSIPEVKYQHRHWQNADLYFLFNEGVVDQKFAVTVDGYGKASVWDADAGIIKSISSSSKTTVTTTLPVELKGHHSLFLVIEH
ncbi:glycosyl hydrolase [Mucilaginibacter sp. CSA2-8R]|uniref:glycosyl hydrolase n=1 Tax=Mucilaginibacter sp. CSA2-8R TaxID=3141542 RepID=UPI00315C7049